nr:hypothetical protein CFP56_19333 [Quercus suber]
MSKLYVLYMYENLPGYICICPRGLQLLHKAIEAESSREFPMAVLGVVMLYGRHEAIQAQICARTCLLRSSAPRMRQRFDALRSGDTTWETWSQRRGLNRLTVAVMLGYLVSKYGRANQRQPCGCHVP